MVTLYKKMWALNLSVKTKTISRYSHTYSKSDYNLCGKSFNRLYGMRIIQFVLPIQYA